MRLSTQYNKFAKTFSGIHNVGKNSNNYNRKVFYSFINFIKPGIKLLDVACGDGFDLANYQKFGAKISGIDASKEMIIMAKKRLPNADICLGKFEKLPFPDNHFDAVLSKYAIMTSRDMRTVFSEMLRVLKPGGIMLYLVTHPFRQYFEKKNSHADYFKQQVVIENILNKSIKVKEPTHTMGEYFNDFLFRNFEILAYDERWDPAAEQIGGRKYPGFLIVKARKK